METFNRIKAKVGLKIECTVINDFQNVSDGLEDEVVSWFGLPDKSMGMAERYMRVNEEQHSPYPSRLWPVIIQAPTGSGKNYFVINLLAPEVEKRGGRVLVLTNRTALTLQQREEADAANGFPLYSQKVYEKCFISGNMDIIDYQEALKYLDDEMNSTIAYITTVVFDEVHFFTDDATFTKSTSVILQRLIKRFFHCKRIYMSATPEEVEPIIALEELRASINYLEFNNMMIIGNTKDRREKNESILKTGIPGWDKNMTRSYDVVDLYRACNLYGYSYPLISDIKIKKYVFKKNFDYVKLHFFYDWEVLVNYLKSSEYEEKWILFVQEREEGRNIKKNIGTDAIFISSNRDKKESETFQNIVEDKKFSQKVLVSTTVLYNGVSIEDEYMKHIAVDSVDQAAVIQMLGRKRFKDDKSKFVNLYVKVPSEDMLQQRMNSTDNLGKYVYRFERDGMGFLFQSLENEYFDDKIRNLIKEVNTETGKKHCVSEYAYTRLANEGSNYKKFLNLSKQGDFSVEKEICQWFGKDFTEEMIIKVSSTPNETENGKKAEILKEIRSFLDIFVDESPFDAVRCEELCMGLKSMWKANKKYFSSERPDTRHKPGRLDKNGNLDYTRLVPDIRNILEKFGLQYKVEQTYRENADQSTWRYICLRLEVNE